MFFPRYKTNYKFVSQQIKNCILVESFIMMTFTEENIVYNDEICQTFDHYECRDNHGNRFICYVNYNHTYCFLKYLSNDERIICFYPSKVYINEILLFKNSLTNF